MKRIIVVSFLAAIACAPLSSFGQSLAPAVSDTPAAAPPAPPKPGLGASLLTPEERDTLMAAAQKARQDPAVKAAAEKMHEAMKAARDAMIATDKSLGPLIDKIEAATSSPSPGVPRPTLTADEREQLRAGRDAIKGTPAADAWQKATAEYFAALRQAMIAADASVAAILDKLPQGGPLGHGVGGAGPPRPSASASPQQ